MFKLPNHQHSNAVQDGGALDPTVSLVGANSLKSVGAWRDTTSFLSVADADVAAAAAIANTKLAGLVNLGANIISTYPLSLGVDFSMVGSFAGQKQVFTVAVSSSPTAVTLPHAEADALYNVVVGAPVTNGYAAQSLTTTGFSLVTGTGTGTYWVLVYR